MDPLNHALIGALVIKQRRGWPAFILGSVIPDIPLLVAAAVHLLRGGSLSESYQEIMSWMWVRAADYWAHSLIVVLSILAFGWVARLPMVKAFAWGYALHFAIDFLTHVDDASPPLWPFSPWVFRSPISYWQVQYLSRPFTLLISAVLFALLYFWWRDRKKRI